MDYRKKLGLSKEGNTSATDCPEGLSVIKQKIADLKAISSGEANPCAADKRIHNFLNIYLEDVLEENIQLPEKSFVLDRHGLARIMSLPEGKDSFSSKILSSYRIKQGILHNPKNDRRTTKGAFHVAEGGLPVSGDKLTVPKKTFAKILLSALNPPDEFLTLPFTANQKNPEKIFTSLLLRPIVCPEVPGFISEKTNEIRFFAPGSLVSNLDFVESIFGNAGDPFSPENDAALDIHHWTGHTGCVILAPHLITHTKKELGLPHFDEATDIQKRDGMCWKDDKEIYNDGYAFKATCRDERGIMVTVIADNYFGYCKKEVKTQISFSSNLYGLSEEEHSGGAIAFPSYDLGEEFHLEKIVPENNSTFKDIVANYQEIMALQPEGYGIDKKHPHIIYIPEDARFSMSEQNISWTHENKKQSIKLLAAHIYILPSGYKISLEKQLGSQSWKLIGTLGEGTFCHKPCTVSGGGKSEISKSIQDAMIQGPVFTADFHQDIETVSEILKTDFAKRFKQAYSEKRTTRPVLSPQRSLGSVIKLFTPSAEFSDKYNQWLDSIPRHIKDMVFVVKRHYRPEWGDNWQSHFSVDMINGSLGYELKYQQKKLYSNYLRVGRETDGAWRIYKLRQDYNACEKIQTEDDITASVVIPKKSLAYLNENYDNESVKIVTNCENRLFQRPDDCIHPGYDKQAEIDLTSPNSFLSNYEPLSSDDAHNIVQDAMGFDLYSEPVKKLISDFEKEKNPDYFVCSSIPRLVDNKPSKNPRYLQTRPDLVQPEKKYLAEIGTRLYRKVPLDQPVHFPVNAVLPGRRNNPKDEKNSVPALAIYNPIHYQELPELFLDFICSVTGKSPSTTGFGSEGALTKGPFNAIWASADLNNALVSYLITGYDGFASAAGYIGPKYQVDHDISLLMPEIWSRMTVQERAPKFLIENGYLEAVENFEHKDGLIPANLLGYRITIKFVHSFLGRIFNNPNAVFTEEMLKPELQDIESYVEGIKSIVSTQKRVAEHYFEDGSIESVCPPIKALLHIMAKGHYEGQDRQHPEIRKMFTKEYLIESDWYQERLKTKQSRDVSLWNQHINYLENFSAKQAGNVNIKQLLQEAKIALKTAESSDYYNQLHGTIGADPLVGQLQENISSKNHI